MGVFTTREKTVARYIGELGFTNPFLEERIVLERKVLGKRFVPLQRFWNATRSEDENPNVVKITHYAHDLLHAARTRISDGASFADDDEKSVYRALGLFALYYVCEDSFYRYMRDGKRTHLAFDAFEERVSFYFSLGAQSVDDVDAAHLFALFFVIRRAFHFTFRYIFGASRAVARLRASVWESIFTSSMERYHRSLYQRMDRISTLVLGKTGTGKDLVARAIGYSRYIPYQRETGDFAASFTEHYLPLNLTALSPTLIESELFGYVRGAFTGAQKDSAGYLDRGGPYCTMFLDEVGDISKDIQVKLLRVLQSGEYTRVGHRQARTFEGKIVAATNLDLPALISENRFREDLYFRLCSDVIVTPTLFEQVADEPEELVTIVRQLACQIAGDDECDGVTEQTMAFILEQMPKAYAWPGNIRELEQCVCNVMVRGRYEPMCEPADATLQTTDPVTNAVSAGTMTAEELLRLYCTVVYAQTGSYVETAKRLDIDRRTVRARIDDELLATLKTECPET
ncbi:MAG: sigma-54-dependent Fis family transcriptional regulator [Deltaproteobacteria bacterium]|nr:sigma-54-dependent Fis family transcriptional regulator [Deltaproteobacteria bacterium]MBN2671983.1 sigma-54-dependent Fis family transcriptional regulator [Deltaproteobacteria bacterium]